MRALASLTAMKLVSFGLVLCATTGAARAQTVNLGNLLATSDSSSERVTFIVPAGGPYLGFMVRTSFEPAEGVTPSSSFARMTLVVPGVGVIFPTTDVAQGSSDLYEPRVITWFGNLPSIASGSSMTLATFQLSPTGFDSFAAWHDTTITFIPGPGSATMFGTTIVVAARRKRTSNAA